MGYYTKLKFKANLRKDTPEEIISILKRTINERDLGHDKMLFESGDVFKPEFDIPFFKCERWFMLLMSTNWGNQAPGGKFYKSGSYWTLELETEFKNYDNEIDHFIDWISPWVAGRKKKQYVGYYKGEGRGPQINIYVERVGSR